MSEKVTYPNFSWKTEIFDRELINKQSRLMPIENEITIYKSGASNKSDLIGYMKARSPVGVCVLDTSKLVRTMLGEYASSGLCFIDSGAFRHFTKKQKDKNVSDVDFNEVFKRYLDIINECQHPENIIVVAPSVVGEQLTSLALFKKHLDDIKSLIKAGVKVMLPIQKGKLSIEEHFQTCCDLAGFEFIAGLPSNIATISKEDVLNFIKTKKPKKVHFLGCDKCELMYAGKERLMTEMKKEIVDDVVLNALQGCRVEECMVDRVPAFDETDFLGDIAQRLTELTELEFKRFAKEMNCNAGLLKAAMESGNNVVWNLLDGCNHGYGDTQVLSFWHRRYEKKSSHQVRGNIVFNLAR